MLEDNLLEDADEDMLSFFDFICRQAKLSSRKEAVKVMLDCLNKYTIEQFFIMLILN